MYDVAEEPPQVRDTLGPLVEVVEHGLLEVILVTQLVQQFGILVELPKAQDKE